MVPSTQRLSRIDFTTLLAQKDLQVVFNRIGTIKYRFFQENEGNTPQIAVVSSGKQQKSAVKRNKARRRMYTIVSQSPVFKGVQMIVYLSKNAYDMEYSEYAQQTTLLLTRMVRN